MDKLDELDYAILKLLIQDAKTPYTEVGKILNVSSGTIHVRMRKLEQAGIVTGSTLAIDYEALGLKMGAFLGVDLIQAGGHEDVIKKLKEIPQILTAYFVSGPHPILARIVCRDKNELAEILKTAIFPIEGVRDVQVYVTLTEYFNRTVKITETTE
jgi:Lrp/AsnC family transcriptional regulator for asnA, asnC and gidA